MRYLLLGGAPAESPIADHSYRWFHRRHYPTRSERPIAFLATFTAERRSDVVPIFPGVTRIGRNGVFSDLADLPKGEPTLEGRQWIVLSADGEVWIADDHSTNQSFVTPVTARTEGVDPRCVGRSYIYTQAVGNVWSEKTDLDWAGESTRKLTDGDVVFAAYAAWVFGFIPAKAHWPPRR